MKYKKNMTKIFKLEDFQAWGEARELAKLIDLVINCLPRTEDYNLKKHLREGKRNIPGNIAEGFGRYFYRDSTQFYRVALGSLNELKSDVYLCFDAGYINEGLLNKCLRQIDKVERLIKGSVVSAKRIKTVSQNT